MSKKNHRKWYGRPNAPPLNWHAPDNPVVRNVTGSNDDIPPRPPVQDDAGLIAVTLVNSQWITILRALYLYGQTYGDEDWKAWRWSVRKTIIGVVNPNTDDSEPVAVRLSLEDWRMIWQQVNIACKERGDQWVTWFDSLSQTMTEQIKGK